MLPSPSAAGYSRTEIMHLIETERVVRLSDIVLRAHLHGVHR